MTELTREQWLAERRRGLGGSDAGAVLDINPYRSRVDVYLDKTGQAEDVASNELMYWGNVLEAVVADEFCKRTGKQVIRRNKILEHPKHPWMLGNVDRLVLNEDAGLECKTANDHAAHRWGPDGSQEMPGEYVAQCAHYMAVTGRSKWYVAVLIGGNDFRWYELDRDPTLEAEMVEEMRAFWFDNVLARVAPEPREARDIEAIFPVDDGSTVQGTVEIITAVRELKRVKAQLKEVDGRKESLETIIKGYMKDAQILLADGKKAATWKTSETTRIDTTALKQEEPETAERFSRTTSSRRFLVK